MRALSTTSVSFARESKTCTTGLMSLALVLVACWLGHLTYARLVQATWARSYIDRILRIESKLDSLTDAMLRLSEAIKQPTKGQM